MGHTASFYWQGKMPAAAFFTTVPFGLTPGEHVAWVDAGGGQALWDELYAPFGVKPFMGGNTGVCMGGWFRNEIKGKADLSGTKIRSLGLGGEVYRRLGATPGNIANTTMPITIAQLRLGAVDLRQTPGSRLTARKCPDESAEDHYRTWVAQDCGLSLQIPRYRVYKLRARHGRRRADDPLGAGRVILSDLNSVVDTEDISHGGRILLEQSSVKRVAIHEVRVRLGGDRKQTKHHCQDCFHAPSPMATTRLNFPLTGCRCRLHRSTSRVTFATP
jgi:hypothetical protein